MTAWAQTRAACLPAGCADGPADCADGPGAAPAAGATAPAQASEARPAAATAARTGRESHGHLLMGAPPRRTCREFLRRMPQRLAPGSPQIYPTGH